MVPVVSRTMATGVPGFWKARATKSAVACSSRFSRNCSGGGHCWDTRLDSLMDIQVCRRCPGRRLRGRCALFSSRCPWDGGEVLRSSGHDSLPAGFGRQPLPAWLAHAGCIAGNSLSVERCLAFNCRKIHTWPWLTANSGVSISRRQVEITGHDEVDHVIRARVGSSRGPG